MKTLFRTISILCLLCVMTFVPFAHNVQAAVMSSGNYSLQADSVNFGGVRSSSGSYALEDTGGEVGTGDLDGTSNKLFAGYQQADTVTATPTPTPTTTSPTVSSPSSSGSRLPVNVINFIATAGNENIFLSWQYPLGSDIQSVRIVRSEAFFPLGINDGEVIFEGNALDVIDHNVVPGVQYYYTIFAENSRGLYSSGVLASARITPTGEVVPVQVPIDPFVNIPDAANVHPIISALTLLDFDFIQDGKKIEHAGSTVIIDGRKNLTVRLAYNKVPQLLKTIAISLADPDDQTKIFTFLLRVNADETAYEATIAPLAKSGTYKLHAIVLDYQNQGLKRLEGNLRAVVFEGIAGLTGRGGIPMNWIWLLIILISIICIIILSRRIRNNKKSAQVGSSEIPEKIDTSVYKKILSLLIIGTMVATSSGIYTSSTYAAINKQINYQGKLADSAGDVVADGTYAMEFKLYTASSGGSAVWTESLTGANEVQVTDGLFSVMLGAVTALTSVDFNQTLYLGVNIESDGEMTPRKIIGAVPSAFVADTLDGLDSTQFLRADTGSATIGYFVATSTTASTLPYASSTALTVSGALYNTSLSTGGVAVNSSGLLYSYATSTWTFASSTLLSDSNTFSGNQTFNGNVTIDTLNGPLQANNGVVSATSSIGVLYGGTGLNSIASSSLLIGGPNNTFIGIATSSLGLLGSADLNGYLTLANWYSTTTDDIDEGLTNFYWTNDRFDTRLSATTTLPNLTTLLGLTDLITTRATTTNATTTSLYISGPISGAGLTSCSGAGDKLIWNATTRLFECGADAGAGGGITALRAEYSSYQTGGSQTFATSSDANLLMTITSAGDIHTFTPSWTGTLSVARGGTGQTSFGQGWLGINDSGAFVSSTSPTVAYITATSTATSTFSGSIAVTEANATSTFAGGIDLSDGCFAVDGVCLGGSSYSDSNTNAYIHASSTIPKTYTANTFTSTNAFATLTATSFNLGSGLANMLAGFDSSGNLTSTSSPQVAYINATSTTATSTFAGGLSVAGTSGLTVLQNGNVGIGTTITDGKLHVMNGSAGSVTANINSNTIVMESSGNSGFSLLTPDANFGTIYFGSPSDNFGAQIAWSHNDGNLYLSTENANDDILFRTGAGANAMKLYDNAGLSLGASYAATTPPSSGLIVQGNVGIGTTSPYAKLSVVGEVVGAYFTATTSTASTFPYASTTALTVSGSTYLSGLSTGGVGIGAGGLLYSYATSTWTFASSTLLADSNTFSGNQTFNGNVTIDTLNGPLQANNGVVSATSSVGVLYGGTGLNSIASSSLLIGGPNNTFIGIATSSLGLLGSADLNGYLTLANWYSTTTDALDEGLTNFYWTNDRFDTRLSATTTLPNLTTLLGLTDLITTRATTTNATTTSLYISGPISGAGLTSCSGAGDKLIWNATTRLFECGADAGAGGGITALRAEYSSYQTGGSQTFATSSDANLLMTITSAGDVHTFTPSWTGTLSVARGGTGQSSFGQGWLHSDGTTMTSSTSPTVNYIIATSTTRASVFPYASTTALTVSGALYNTSLSTGGVAVNSSGLLYSYATSTWTFASSTLLADSNTFTGTNAFAGLTASSFNLGSGLANMLAGFDASGNLTSTSSPQVAYINATSSTATSTFAGGLNVAGTSGLTVLQNGKVGVGTVSPGTLFDVNRSTSGDVAKFENSGWSSNVTITAGSSNNILFKAGLADSLGFSTNNSSTAYLTIDSSGLVGIGTTSPHAKLTVNGDVYFAGKITATSTATSTFAGSIAVTEANATSTFAGGIDLSDGCFAVDGVCLGGSSYGDTNTNAYIHASSTIPKTYTANTFTGANTFSGNFSLTSLSAGGIAVNSSGLAYSFSTSTWTFASSTLLSDSNTFSGNQTFNGSNIFGGANTFNSTVTIGSLTGPLQAVNGLVSASSTLAAVYGGTGWSNIQSGSLIYGNGADRLATTSTGTAGYVLSYQNGVPTWVATTTYSSGLTYANGNVTNSGVLAVGPTGQTQTGTVTFATSSSAFNGLTASTTITGAGNTLTFTNTLAGLLGVAGGGTGLSSYTLGDVLYANGTGSLAGTSTANLKTTLGLNDVENTALSTWAGSTNITTLGTITSGTWNGTTIAVNKGGTGQTSFGQGWLHSDGTTMTSSTSPTVNYITATSTTATSTFAGGLTVDGTSLVVDHSTGHVGVGTASPSYKLQISDSVNAGAGLLVQNNTAGTIAASRIILQNDRSSLASYALLQHYSSASTITSLGGESTSDSTLLTAGGASAKNLFITTANAYPVIMGTNNTERMRITSAGLVGIGTTSPYAKLSVDHLSTSGTVIGTDALTGFTGKLLDLKVASSTKLSIDQTGAITSAGFSGAGGVAVNSSGLLYSYATSTWTFASSTLLSDSNTWTGTNAFAGLTASSFNLGSGLANMLAGFDASGNLTSTSSPQVAYINATSSTATSTFAGGISGPGNFTVQSSSGRVGIGTTNPAHPLQIVTGTDSTGIALYNSAGTSNYGGIFLSGGDSGALNLKENNVLNIYISANTGTNNYINNSGNFGIGTTSPHAKLTVNGDVYFAGKITATSTATSTFAGSIAVTEANATSTFAGGIDLSDGCFAVDGACLSSGGGGTVTSVTAGSGLSGGVITTTGTIALDLTSANIWTGLQQFNNASSTRFSVFDTAYFGGTATSTFNSAGVLTLASALAVTSGGTGWANINSGYIPFGNGASALATSSSFYWDNTNARLGIGTSSPYAKLSVAGEVVASHFTATSTTATSTFAGSFNVGNGAIFYDSNTGTTSISYLEAGNMTFAADSGVISWIDMPVTSASANGVVNSYSANLNGNSLLTIYGISDGAGGVTNTAVGIGTTSPNWKLSVAGIGSFDNYVRASYFTSTSTTASTFPYASSTALTVSGALYNTSLSTGGVAVNSSGLLYSYATSTWTFASSTLLSDSNTFSGNNTFSNTITGSITGNAGTATILQTARNINNTPFNGSADITITAASSTLLSDSNTWTGTNAFAGLTASSFNLGSGLANMLAGFDSSGNLTSTSSPQVAYINATSTTATSTFAGGLNVHSGTLVVDYSTNNVGVGTASPGNKLVVSGGNTTSGIRLISTAINASGFDLRPNQGDDTHGFGIYDNNASLYRLSIDGSGNVGIGTTTPGTGSAGSKLDIVGGNLGLDSQYVFGQGNGYALGSSNASYGTLQLYNAQTGYTILNNQGYGIRFQTAGTDKVTILNGGNVGIGTTTPVNKLDVYGVVGSPDTSGIAQNGVARFTSYSTSVGLDFGVVGSPSAYSWIQSRAYTNHSINYNLVLNPNGGNVGIGTTSPYAKLSIDHLSTSGTVIGTDALTGFTGKLLDLKVASSTKLSIDQTGAITSAGFSGAGGVAVNSSGLLYSYATSTWTFASSTLLSDSNTFSGANTFSGNFSLTSLSAGGIAIDSSGLAYSYATSTWTFASSTLLSDSNRFTGNNMFLASTTIGGGTQTTGLTISGGATTTGNAYFAGNVGIGTPSPQTTLHVLELGTAGTPAIGAPVVAAFQRSSVANATAEVDIISGNTGTASLNFGDTDYEKTGQITYDHSNESMRFVTASAEKMRILTGGNVGIGTTSPYAKLSVEHLSTSGTVIGTDALTGFTGKLLDLKVASSTKLSIDQTGAITSAGFSGAGGVAVNSSGLLYSYATSTWTFASSTLLADSNTWTGTNAFAGLTASSFNLGSGLANMLAGFDSSGNLTSTSSPQVAYINATSTTATSTFAGGISGPGSFTVQSSSGRVGIGNTIPGNKLTIDGAPSATDYQLGVRDTTAMASAVGGGMTLYGQYTSGGSYSRMGAIKGSKQNSTSGNLLADLLFQTPASSASDVMTTRMTIQSDGNVGIGTTSPARNLNVLSSSAIGAMDVNLYPLRLTSWDSNGTNFWNRQGSGLEFEIAGSWGSGVVADIIGRASAAAPQTNGDLLFRTNQSGTLATAMIINSTGLVGIGTTSPYAKLSIDHLSTSGTVIGTDALTGFTGKLLDLKVASSTKLSIDQTGAITSAGFSGAGGVAVNSSGLLYSYATSTWTFASSTLLADSNTWTGTNAFAGLTASSFNLGSGLANMLAGFDSSGNLTSTSSPQVAYINATSTTATSTFAGGLNVHSGTLVVDYSTNNVGVGTASPGNKLVVSGGNTTSGIRLISTAINASGFDLRPNQGDDTHGFGIYDNNASLYRLSIDGSGNVGIGTTTPTSLLQVAGATAPKITLSDTDASADQKHWFIESNTGKFAIGTTSDALATNSSYRALTIDASGNVGINTASPTTGYGMTIKNKTSSGGLFLDTLATSQQVNVDFGSAGSAKWSFYKQTDDDFSIYSYGAVKDALTVKTATGYVGILNGSASYPLDVAGFINTDQYSGYKQGGTTILFATTSSNIFVGQEAGALVTSGSLDGNSALGYRAMYNASSTGADKNVALGYEALKNNNAQQNVAVGYQSMLNNYTGAFNVALGGSTLVANITGSNNVAIGYQALLNTNVSDTIAIGNGALGALTTGTDHTAIGYQASNDVVSANSSTALGSSALRYTTGGLNTAVGVTAGQGVNATSDFTNSALFGYASGLRLTTGDGTAAFGYTSGDDITSGNNNACFGPFSCNGLTSGSTNIGIGYNVQFTDATASGQININSAIFGVLAGGDSSTPDADARIGIGSSTPVARLSVQNTAAVNSFQVNDESNDLSPFVIDASGNVGIATSTPWRALSVHGSSDLGINALAGYFTATTSTASIFPYASTTMLSATTASTTNLIISSAGGSGTRCLQVGSDGTVSANASACGSGSGTFSWTPTTNYGAVANATGTPIWFQAGLQASSTSHLTYASTTAITVAGNAYFPGSGIWNSSGNVGIGTTSPYAKLSVVGEVVAPYYTATSTTATSTFAGGLNVGGGNFMYDLSTGITSAATLQTGNMNFDTDAGLVSWVDLPLSSASNGSVQGYTASLNGSSTISVYGVSAGSGWLQATYPRVGIASSTPWRTFSVSGTVALSGLTSSATGNAVCITTAKDITDAGGGTCTPSSERFKENIVTLAPGSALDQLSDMRVVSFDYKDGYYSTEEASSSVGLIAEEVEKINPVLVDYGYDGKPLTLHFERLTGLTIQAIQEQQLQIGELASSTALLSTTSAALAIDTAAAVSGIDQLKLNFASSSQSTKTLAKAIDTTNQSLADLATYIDGFATSTSALDARLSATEAQLLTMTASTTLADAFASSTWANVPSSVISMIASSTAELIASSTVEILASSSPSFITRVAQAVKEIIEEAGDWALAKVTATLAVFNRVETQTAAVSQGLEMTDQVTGEKYCVTIQNGDWNKKIGACGVATQTQTATVPAPVPTPATVPAQVPVANNNVTPAVAPTPVDTATSSSATTPVTEGSASTPAPSSTPTPTPTPADEGSAPVTTPESTPASVPAPETAPASTPESTPTPAPEPAPAPAPTPEPAPAPAPEPAPVPAPEPATVVTATE